MLFQYRLACGFEAEITIKLNDIFSMTHRIAIPLCWTFNLSIRYFGKKPRKLWVNYQSPTSYNLLYNDFQQKKLKKNNSPSIS